MHLIHSELSVKGFVHLTCAIILYYCIFLFLANHEHQEYCISMKYLLVLGSVIAALCVSVWALQDDAVVVTKSGPLQGLVSEDDGYRAFLGVPFAAPPVGELRWVNPQPVSSWTSVRDATKLAAGCPQSCDQPPGTCPVIQSEDCLYLNVHTPYPVPTKPLPVMVFLPGGRFMQGGSQSAFYSAQHLAARQQMIVVVISYRLSALGFYVGEEKDGLNGNYGLEDQRAAFRWVQDNIAAFGGDPSRVTLAGESAGGTSIAIHTVSPRSKGLFHSAIIESNPWSMPIKTLDQNRGYGDRLSEHVGCAPRNTTCMRAVPADVIVQWQSKCAPKIPFPHTLRTVYAFSPTIDSADNVPGEPLAVLIANGGSSIPILMGTNLNEGTMFIYEGANFTVSRLEAEAFFTDVFGLKAASIFKEFPIPSSMGDDVRPWLVDRCTEYIFACSSRRAASMLKNVWLYQFVHPLSFKGAWGPLYPFCEGKVCHGTELPFVFNTPDVGGYAFTNSELVLVDAVESFWTNHVVNGSPGKWQGISWPQWSATQDVTMTLDLSISVGTNAHHDACNFWDTIGYNR
jgi:carboxylesterase type B